MRMRTYLIAIVVMILAGAGGWFTYARLHPAPAPEPVAEILPPTPTWPLRSMIGKSVDGRNIEQYTYGDGPRKLLFVGGIHGGYEWNSVLLAYRFIDYLESIKTSLPEGLAITVIPNINPDAVFKIVGKEGRFTEEDVPQGDVSHGRFNAHDVDLNRNFGCKWSPEGTWRSQKVSTGSEAFSEPESRALRDFVLAQKPTAVVFWHSQANAVYASECEEGVLPETVAIMHTYANAAGYKAVESFDAYAVTGDAEGWLASIGIPAITVELSAHDTIEWEKNLAGVKALIASYTETGVAR